MPRRPRRDYPGAVHHVYVRGVARSIIAVDDVDFERSLFLLGRTVARFEITCQGWCFLPNHFHLLVTSELGNLSKAMQWFNSGMAQTFNKRHERTGHLYQGRFGSRLIVSQKHFLELARYLPLNPVRAALCGAPADWQWSSYAATAGLETPPWFLNAGTVVESFGTLAGYVSWVAEGMDINPLDEHGVPRPPPRPSLVSLLPDGSDRNIAIAHFEHGYTQVSIAKHLAVSTSQVSRRLA
jgi:REP-associated tyrosine transposase